MAIRQKDGAKFHSTGLNLPTKVPRNFQHDDDENL